MSASGVENWLGEHQLITFSVVIPILSGLIAVIASWYSTRRTLATARIGRDLQRTMKVTDFRQAWIDALRDDMSEFAGITAIAYAGPPPTDKIERISTLAMRFMMRMNREDPDYEKLTGIMMETTQSFFLNESLAQGRKEPFVPISQAILKREWERLKSDLGGVEP